MRHHLADNHSDACSLHILPPSANSKGPIHYVSRLGGAGEHVPRDRHFAAERLRCCLMWGPVRRCSAPGELRAWLVSVSRWVLYFIYRLSRHLAGPVHVERFLGVTDEASCHESIA